MKYDNVEDLGARMDAEQARQWPRPINLQALAGTDPTPPDFIIPDWLPCGYATLLAGHGGVGKSGIALHLAVCASLGREFFGLHVAQRRVLYLSCEDREGVLHWRLRRICDELGVSIADLDGRLDVLDLVGHDTLLWAPQSMTGAPMPALTELRQRIAQGGSQLVMVDGISDTFSGNENDRAMVKSYVNALLAGISVDGAALLVGHIAKPAASSTVTTEGYSGSTGWHNAVRARWYLYPETKKEEGETERTGDLKLELQKSNFGRTDQQMRFRWDDDRHLFVGQTVVPQTTLDRQARDRRERAGIIAALNAVYQAGDYCPAATTGARSAYNVLTACPEFPTSLHGGKPERDRFWRLVEGLRRHGEITEGSRQRVNRHKVATLEPANASESAPCVAASHAC